VDIFVHDPDAHCTFFQNVERVAAVVFVKDSFAGLVIDLIDFFGQMLELVRLKSLEERDASQALRFFTEVVH
jgi:hypothetical protein